MPKDTWLSLSRFWTILWGLKNKYSIVKNVVIIIHVPFTEVWQSRHSLHLKAHFLENLCGQIRHLLFPSFSFQSHVFFGTLPSSSWKDAETDLRFILFFFLNTNGLNSCTREEKNYSQLTDFYIRLKRKHCGQDEPPSFGYQRSLYVP